MNQKQYVVAGLMCGSILGALICAGIVVAIAHQQPAPVLASAATSTMTVDSLPKQAIDAQFVFYVPTSTFYLDLNQTSTPCLIASTQGICLVSFKDFKADAQLLKAIRSGNFVISENISVPIGNGSSTDLMSVLNYMQSEMGK